MKQFFTHRGVTSRDQESSKTYDPAKGPLLCEGTAVRMNQ